jgi:O-antigen ligase
MSLHRTTFDWPLLLFFFSALWGVGIAYDTTSAGLKFSFICGGLALYYFLSLIHSRVTWRDVEAPVLRIVVGGAPTLIAVYFLLTNDWTHSVEKVAWLEPLRAWLAERQWNAPLPRLHPNLVGGVLALSVPLQAAALVKHPNRKGFISPWSLLGGLEIFLLFVSLVGLLLSGLRGAWLALAAAVGVWLWWRVCERLGGWRGRRLTMGVWLGGLALATLLLVSTAWSAPLLGLRPDRLFVWRNSWDLAWDYFFTGLGLGNFTMAYSSYALLVHVPHTTHAHNLFLDIWLEQGLLGLCAFVWLLVVAFVPKRSQPNHTTRWRTAALMATVVIALHGLVDDSYYGYEGVGALALFVPFALLSRRGEHSQVSLPQLNQKISLALWGMLALGIVMTLVLPATRAAYEANLGALSQTRAELSIYQWPQWPLQDALRRSTNINLTASIEHYRAALALDPTNVTANRRLGQIELSLGAYDEARHHLEAAHRAAPQQQATQQLFGESLALTGDVARAAALWRAIPLEQDQLAIRHGWYSSANDAQSALRAQWVTEAIVLARKK